MASVGHEAIVDFAKQKLETGAKQTQDKAGGIENASVVSAQVVIPSKLGKETEEVSSHGVVAAFFWFGL